MSIYLTDQLRDWPINCHVLREEIYIKSSFTVYVTAIRFGDDRYGTRARCRYEEQRDSIRFIGLSISDSFDLDNELLRVLITLLGTASMPRIMFLTWISLLNLQSWVCKFYVFTWEELVTVTFINILITLLRISSSVLLQTSKAIRLKRL